MILSYYQAENSAIVFKMMKSSHPLKLFIRTVFLFENWLSYVLLFMLSHMTWQMTTTFWLLLQKLINIEVIARIY